MTQETKISWTVFQCNCISNEEKLTKACGFNGSILDASYDECHHVLSLEDAKLIVKAVNERDELIEALKEALPLIKSALVTNELYRELFNKIEKALSKAQEEI